MTTKPCDNIGLDFNIEPPVGNWKNALWPLATVMSMSDTSYANSEHRASAIILSSNIWKHERIPDNSCLRGKNMSISWPTCKPKGLQATCQWGVYYKSDIKLSAPSISTCSYEFSLTGFNIATVFVPFCAGRDSEESNLL